MSELIATLPADWRRITTLDMHTEGEPLRLVLSGVPTPVGDSVAQRRIWAMEHMQGIRQLLMLEPRGHGDMYGAILTPPDSDAADAGVLFLHNEGFSTMCGHGVIAVSLAVSRFQLIPTAKSGQVVLDTPAGRVFARVDADSSENRVGFLNVPSFVVEREVAIDVDGLSLRVDVAFGGAYYAFVNAEDCNLELVPAEITGLIGLGRAIKAAVSDCVALRHPLHRCQAALSDTPSELDFLYGVIFHGPADSGRHSRHVCVFADGEVDRSPTGTGVSARAALLHDEGAIGLGQAITIQSLVGGEFSVRVVGTSQLAGLPIVLPEVTGRAWVTGKSQWVLDPSDAFAQGFLLR